MTTKADLVALAAEAIKRGHPVKRLAELQAETRLAREIHRIWTEKPTDLFADFNKGHKRAHLLD